MSRDYTKLSLDDVAAELSASARDAQALFGRFDERQLNWRPNARSWSIAQCFDHLLNANREMFQTMDAAIHGSPTTMWQRLPVLPRVWGLMLIRSQAPQARRKYTAPRKAEPATSAIDRRIIERFVADQQEAVRRVRSLDGGEAARVIMVSPYVRFITYSVLDGCRLVVAHGRRHLEQARRVAEASGFPALASQARG